jgi:hypothetical protein
MAALALLVLYTAAPVALGIVLILTARRMGRTPDPLTAVLAEHHVIDGEVAR